MYGVDKFGNRGYTLKRGADPYELLSTCEARLTLSSGNPRPTTSVTAATSVYLTSLGQGNRILLYDTTVGEWVPRALEAEISVAVPSTLFRVFDLFPYWNGAAVAMEAVSWDQTTGTITAATSASPCVVTSTAHGLPNGALIGIAGIVGVLGTDTVSGLNGTVWTVANAAANTFEPQGADTSLLAYTSGGTWYRIPNTRTTALATQDGAQCKTGDLSRRFVGTGMTTGVSGQCETSFGGVDSPPLWNLWNLYNQEEVELRCGNSLDSYTYSTAAFRAIGNRAKLARAGWINGAIAGVTEQQAEALALFLALDAVVGQPIGAIDLDGFAASDGFLKATAGAPNTVIELLEFWRGHTGIGFHYLAPLEYGAGATTWYGDAGAPSLYQSGMTVRIKA